MALLKTPKHKMESISGAGVGMIATNPILRGDLIISEAPLFTISANFTAAGEPTLLIASKVRALPKDKQRLFFSLHNAYAQELSPFLGITKTNAHPLGVDSEDCAVFLECSRFNHSCAPNANYSWNRTLSCETIYAVKDIMPGEQITVAYLDEEAMTGTRSHRQQILKRDFRFECCCETCRKSPEEIKVSDARRQEITRLDRIIGGGSLLLSNPAGILGYCRRILQLFKEEGVNDILLYRTYYDALQICVAHGDLARASAFASLGVEMLEICQGKDAPNLDQVQPYIKHPEKHQLSGTSRKWQSQTNSAREIGSDSFEEWLWGRT